MAYSSSGSWLGTITFDQTMPTISTTPRARPKALVLSSAGQECHVRVNALLLAVHANDSPPSAGVPARPPRSPARRAWPRSTPPAPARRGGRTTPGPRPPSVPAGGRRAGAAPSRRGRLAGRKAGRDREVGGQARARQRPALGGQPVGVARGPAGVLRRHPARLQAVPATT